MMRRGMVARRTKETDIRTDIILDGKGAYRISTTIPFLDHMLTLFCRHGLFDLKVKAAGDTEIDDHHTVEDAGIALGKAVREALGDMKAICRYGEATVPMDEALVAVALDISGRGFLVYRAEFPKRSKLKGFDPDLVEDFLQAFAANAGLTLHVNVHYGRNTHHIIEGVFKALGRALRMAVAIDPRGRGVPSTKGSL